MQKTTILSHVENGKQFIYNNTIYTKVRVSSYSNVIPKDLQTGVSLSGGEVVVLSWSTNVKVEVPDVQLSTIVLGKKFKYGGNEYVKVKCVAGKYEEGQYGLKNNEVITFSANPYVELID